MADIFALHSMFGVRRLAFGICFCLMAAGVTARDLPRLICAEPEYCFGTLSNTNEVPHTFVLVNEGMAPLVIYRVQTDCGCTLVRLRDKIIHPGEQTTVQVWLALKGRAGNQHKRVTIVSNDPDHPRLTLSLIGEAVAELEVKPDRIYWGNLRSDAAEVKTVDIRFDEAAPGHITGAGVMSSAFVVDLATNKPGRAYRIRVRSVPPLGFGQFAVNVWITTDSSRYPRISVPMQGRVVGDIYAVPDEIRLESDNTQAVSRLLMVQSSCRQRFNILKVQPPLTNILTQVRSTLTRGYRVELRNILPGPALDGKCLVITTDCVTMPELTVPFRIGPPP